jgi:homogentisate 1,2-dioxygenase
MSISSGKRSNRSIRSYPVGWDGYLYPWTFSVHDFEPITGRIHQPPPSHQRFQGRNFVICSFCRRAHFSLPKG